MVPPEVDPVGLRWAGRYDGRGRSGGTRNGRRPSVRLAGAEQLGEGLRSAFGEVDEHELHVTTCAPALDDGPDGIDVRVDGQHHQGGRAGLDALLDLLQERTVDAGSFQALG